MSSEEYSERITFIGDNNHSIVTKEVLWKKSSLLLSEKLLQLLSDGLNLEIREVHFDYFAFHKRCYELLARLGINDFEFPRKKESLYLKPVLYAN